MSKYTTQLRFICESIVDFNESTKANGVTELIEKIWDKVFTFDFPIFDEAYRKELCVKILRHYWTREIGQETYGAWKIRLETKLCDIMPYYNQLYKSELLEFNPMFDVDLTRSGDRTNTGKITGTDTGESKTTDLFSDTPQNGLRDVESGEYLTSANVNNNDYSNRNTTNSDTQESFWEKVQGRSSRSGSRALIEFRKTFLNIDMLVIEELEPLFMQLW